MKEIKLREKVVHGTPDYPVSALRFVVNELESENQEFFVENHWHPEIELLFIREGSYQVRINLVNMELKAGDICIVNGGNLHQICSLNQECRHDAFLFDPAILQFEYQDKWSHDVISPFVNQDLLCEHLICPDQEGYDSLRSVVEELFEITLKEEKESFWYERCKIRLLELLLALKAGDFLVEAEQFNSSQDQIQIERYKKIVDYMETHYQENISLETLAAQIPCNSQYLCRFFRNISGETPIQHLIKYRIEQSEKLLIDTNKSISDIALDCGFDNISYYIRKFKELKGLTPGAYRQR